MEPKNQIANANPPLMANTVKIYSCPNGHSLKINKYENCLKDNVPIDLECWYCWGKFCNKCRPFICQTFLTDKFIHKANYNIYQCIAHGSYDQAIFICKECKFYICYKCLDTKHDFKSCIMGHKLKFTGSQTMSCFNHHTITTGGYVCKENCYFFLCRWCIPVKFDTKKCVNDHDMEWRNQVTNFLCINHGQNKRKYSGFVCKEGCDYFICDDCNDKNFKYYITDTIK